MKISSRREAKDLKDAQSLMKDKNYLGALKSIEIALKKPRHDQSYLYLTFLKAKANNYLGNFYEAFDDLFKSVYIVEKCTSYTLIMALIDSFNGSIKEYQEVISCLSVGIEKLWGEYKKGKVKKKYLKIFPDILHTRSYLYLGIKNFRKGLVDIDNAININDIEKIKKKEWVIDALVTRSWANINLNFHTSAIKDLEKVLAIKPYELMALINLGYLHTKIKKFKEALNYINEAIKILESKRIPKVYDDTFSKEQLIEAYIYRALIYSLIKEYDKSFSDFELVFKLDIKYGLRRCLIELYKENIFEAIPLEMKNILKVSYI